MALRSISCEFEVEIQQSGNNVNVCRSVGSSLARSLPPFVGCVQFWVDTVGNPPRPARGFQNVTFLLSGSIKVEYSPPNIFNLSPEDVLSVMVGRGVRPKIQSLQGTSTGIQIFVDVPEEYKRQKPTSEIVRAKLSSTIHPFERVAVNILSGSAFGAIAEQALTLTPVTIMYVTVQPGGKFEYSIPDHWNAFLYTTEGSCIVNQELKAQCRHYVEFAGRPKSDASDLPVIVQVDSSQTEAASFIFCTAEALDQPIYHQGPFVDVSRDWISQAYDDYNQHKNGFEQNQMWNDHKE